MRLRPATSNRSLPSGKITTSLALLAAAGLACLCAGAEETASQNGVPPPKVRGLVVRVVDMDESVRFYSRLFAFDIVDLEHHPNLVELRNGSVELTLLRASRPAEIDFPKTAEAHLNMQVEDLEETLEELRRQEVRFLQDEPGQAAIGPNMPMMDPSGNILYVIELNSHEGPLPRPRVFNYGITVTDMAQAREFYCEKLGFEVFSEDYYPPVVPLRESGVLSIVLHEGPTVVSQAPSPDTAQMNLLIAVEDLEASVRDLGSRGVIFLDQDCDLPTGDCAAFHDPFGNVHHLVRRP